MSMMKSILQITWLTRGRAKQLTAMLQRQSQARNEKYVGQLVQVMIEGPSEETELLLQGRMPTQAQEIDGHVLINDLSELGEGVTLRPGDLIEVEITEAHTHDLVGQAVRMISEGTAPGLRIAQTESNASTPSQSDASASREWREEKALAAENAAFSV
jgi:hypothetical protein